MWIKGIIPIFLIMGFITSITLLFSCVLKNQKIKRKETKTYLEDKAMNNALTSISIALIIISLVSLIPWLNKVFGN